MKTHLLNSPTLWLSEIPIMKSGGGEQNIIKNIGVFYTMKECSEKIEEFQVLNEFHYEDDYHHHDLQKAFQNPNDLCLIASISTNDVIKPLFPSKFYIRDIKLQEWNSISLILNKIFELMPTLKTTDGYFYTSHIGFFKPRNLYCAFDHLGVAKDLLK